jgi:hypothetical protein
MLGVFFTRYPAQIKVLRDAGLLDATTPIEENATAENVRDRVVGGVLPLYLAVLAITVFEPQRRFEPHDRGRQKYLTSEEWKTRYHGYLSLTVATSNGTVPAGIIVSQNPAEVEAYRRLGLAVENASLLEHIHDPAMLNGKGRGRSQATEPGRSCGRGPCPRPRDSPHARGEGAEVERYQALRQERHALPRNASMT